MSPVDRWIGRARRAILVAGVVTFGLSLAGHALLGAFMRYSGDDYCYAAEIVQRGFWEAQRNAYFGQANYSGNRYSLTLVAGVSDLFGSAATSVLPVAALALWLTAITLALARGAKAASVHLTRLEAFLLAECLVFFTLDQAPDLPQVVYWRSGMLPYLAPLVAVCFLVALVLGVAGEPSTPRWRLLGIGGLAFFAGGFSETATALFLIGFSLAVLLLLGFRQRKDFRRWIAPVLAAWLGTGLAMLALALSPSTRLRMLQMQTPATPDPILLLQLSAQSAYLFLRSTVRWQFLPNLAVGALFFLLAFQHGSRSSSVETVSLRRVGLGSLCIPPVVFVLVMAVTAPSAYAQQSYPVGRAMVSASFVVVLGTAAFGVFAGWLAARGRAASRLSAVQHTVLLTLAVVAGCFLSLRASRQAAIDLPRFVRWATFWDRRDAEIRTEREAGLMQLEVMEIDHIIPDVAELSPDPRFWYNVCAARYYDVRSIAANQPGWDEAP